MACACLPEDTRHAFAARRHHKPRHQPISRLVRPATRLPDTALFAPVRLCRGLYDFTSSRPLFASWFTTCAMRSECSLAPTESHRNRLRVICPSCPLILPGSRFERIYAFMDWQHGALWEGVATWMLAIHRRYAVNVERQAIRIFTLTPGMVKR